MTAVRGADREAMAPWRRPVIWGCLGLAAATLAAALYLGQDLVRTRAAARTELATEQDGATAAAAADIATVITEVEAVARAAARDIAPMPQPEQTIDHTIERLIARHPDIAAIGVAFEPFAFNPQYRLAAPFVSRTPHGFVSGRLENEYDYTAPNVAWYKQALARGAMWDAVRSDPASGEKFIDFALRIQLTTGKRAVAVVRVSYPVARIAEIVTHLDLGHHGYGILISPEGRPLASPGLDIPIRTERPGDTPGASPGQTAGDRAAGDRTDGAPVETVGAPLDRSLSAALARARAAGHAVTFKSLLTGHTSRLALAQIRGPGWTLATVHSWHDLDLDFTARHRRILVLTIFAVLLPLLLGGAHVALASGRSAKRAVRTAWLWSTVAALTFILAIAAIWALALEGPGTLLTAGQPIASRGALDGFERRVQRQALENARPLPTFVPTGLFIQSVEFLSANNLVVTGYAWQRYAKGSPLTRGIVLPEAEEAEVTEVFHHTVGDEEVIGWRIRATLRQTFSYARFPFDRESVWIRLWPADLERPVVLVPDFTAYKITNPSALPGLERSLFISGWTPISTFFEYRRNGYSTDFGIDASMSHGRRQELYFNIEIVRNFLDPFVSHITPILLVLLLIFAMQMTVTRQAEQKDLLGFNAATIITTCAALFFAVLISHIEVRGALAAKQIFYGEYFYLITYAVILAACINAILFTYDSALQWVQYRDNLLPKLFYWPVVMGAMYGVTLATFY